MPIINRIADFDDEMKSWRRHLHQQPELGFDCHQTAAFVVERLRAFGVDEIHEGIATSGVVAVINGSTHGPTLGLRADMDALPILETTGADWASLTPGKMHACGHDGHTTMLLGAAKYLAETRKFAGRAVLIFQPAEEMGGGGGVMVEQGILDRFGVDQVYALHTVPGAAVGTFHYASGPVMAAVDTFRIDIKGVGGHGAFPHETADPIAAAVAIAQAIQTIVSRNHKATDDLVVSVTEIHAGNADNVIPETAWLGGTIRTFDPTVQAMVRKRMTQIVDGHSIGFGVDAVLDYAVGYPATINDAACAAFAGEVAADVVGATNVNGDATREMGAEDFSYMLQERPGAYLFIGQGAGAAWHHPAFDFNDAVSVYGASYFARLVERAGDRA